MCLGFLFHKIELLDGETNLDFTQIGFCQTIFYS
jgi:hypothetical protein